MDVQVGSAELTQLAEKLATPCRLGDYTLEGLICRTSTALVFVARGGAFGADEGVMKLTGREYARLLKRELHLLNWCQAADIGGIVRPVQSELEWMGVDALDAEWAAAILLPFLDGGDLVQWIGANANQSGLGAHLALEIGEHVGGVLRNLLQLPRPLVHRDVKLQNVLLPYPGAPLNELTLIDLDVSVELDIAIEDVASAPAEVTEGLVADVRGFGELLYDLATGRDPPLDGPPNPQTGNVIFDSLVERCLTSQSAGQGFTCLADDALWRHLEQALAVERANRHAEDRASPGSSRPRSPCDTFGSRAQSPSDATGSRGAGPGRAADRRPAGLGYAARSSTPGHAAQRRWPSPRHAEKAGSLNPDRSVLSRWLLAALGVLLFFSLLVAVVSKVSLG